MMTTKQLYKELDFVNHSRENRQKYALLVIHNPELLNNVLDILFNVDDKVSPRAAWLLEFVAREDLNTILPHLDRIISEMHKVHLDSAVRPIAKVCEYLIEAYYYKTPHKIKDLLTPLHKERIIELSFDYMITNQKVATKAYSMNTLYLLGKEYDWVHPELKQILEQGFASGSAAYKARARKLLKKIKAS